MTVVSTITSENINGSLTGITDDLNEHGFTTFASSAASGRLRYVVDYSADAEL